MTEALVRYIWEQEDATAYTMWQILEQQSETIRTGLSELFGCDRKEIAITRNASEPNIYTTLGELDRFCDQMELIARKGLPLVM